MEKNDYKLLGFYAQDIVVIFINNIIQSLFNSQIQFLEHNLYGQNVQNKELIWSLKNK